jgi:hypothetical protein
MRQQNKRRTAEPDSTDISASVSAPLPAPLSPQWAFVVQLRQGTALTPDSIHGRIEHLVSGKATTFQSLEEARAFMARVLAEMGEKPP